MPIAVLQIEALVEAKPVERCIDADHGGTLALLQRCRPSCLAQHEILVLLSGLVSAPFEVLVRVDRHVLATKTCCKHAKVLEGQRRLDVVDAPSLNGRQEAGPQCAPPTTACQTGARGPASCWFPEMLRRTSAGFACHPQIISLLSKPRIGRNLQFLHAMAKQMSAAQMVIMFSEDAD